MNNKNKENDILESLIKLNIKHEIENSNMNIKLYGIKIKYYQNLLGKLESNKPLFFQKKRIIEYNKKIDEYNKIIDELYQNIEKEYELIKKSRSNLLYIKMVNIGNMYFLDKKYMYKKITFL